jgi:hypothetical protein
MLAIGCLLFGSTSESQAQVYGPGGMYGPYGGYAGGGGQGSTGFAPNFYNRQNQPLSPYLNLLRGGNTAVNYFYGTRPGLASGGYLGPFAPGGGSGGSAMGPRQTFFPCVDTLSEYSPEDPKAGMNPTGHGVGFFNTLGYFGGTSTGRPNQQMGNRGGQKQRPGPKK